MIIKDPIMLDTIPLPFDHNIISILDSTKYSYLVDADSILILKSYYSSSYSLEVFFVKVNRIFITAEEASNTRDFLLYVPYTKFFAPIMERLNSLYISYYKGNIEDKDALFINKHFWGARVLKDIIDIITKQEIDCEDPLELKDLIIDLINECLVSLK